MVGTVVRAVFAQSDATQVTAQFHRVIDQLQEKLPAAVELLIDSEADLLAFASFLNEHWRQIWSDNTQECLNKEVHVAPKWSGSSRTDRPSSGPPEPSMRNNATSGPSPVAT